IELGQLVATVIKPDAKQWFMQHFDLQPENWGKKGPAVDYGAAWAHVSATPFRLFKTFVTEGGIRTPLIIAGPGVKHSDDITPALLHATDLVPTLLELAGAQDPSKQADSKLAPLTGKSLVPLLSGAAES